MGFGMEIGEMGPSDVPEVVSLLNQCYSGSHEFVEYAPQSFLSYVQETSAKVFVLKAGGVKGVATFFKGPWGNKIDLFAIERGERSRELGDTLVSHIEATAGVERLYTIIEEGDPSIDEWRERGYLDDGGWCQLIAELKEELPVPLIRCQAILRTMKRSDLESLVSMTNASFGFQRISTDCLDEWKREEPEFDLDWVFVAESGDRLVSMLVSKPDGEYIRNFGERRGYLGPAATLPEYRNKGLAAALTVMAMNSLRAKGMRTVNLYTNVRNTPSIGLLKKLGFRVARTFPQLAKSFKN